MSSDVRRPVIGVLALQGDVREHLSALRGQGAEAVTVRRPEELAAVDGLVIPGGESTTMVKLADRFGLLEPLRAAVHEGLPAYGSCAGMILLADRLLDAPPDQQTIGGLDVTVRRNAFGRQVDSFESDLAFEGLEGGPVHAVFIRAPWVEEAGGDVVVLGRVVGGAADGRIVAVRQGNLVATSFHPELTGDRRVHALFVDIVRRHRAEQAEKGLEP
ncbi:pyridoxal 5'-phosphate synthase glutaminase subunit PdxT [Blastococcus sp. PRF04-17]|uniref:pyridoxal 5'-phosphate synthase glutaminase subunit PdxT n=1 Tax=Blastococcus sp. PRF04-17 TaxID=2933797 RepID=UPI001FF51020|nr:pyridoxal 5'-phosphate synthase glutaminase subunit PdxT [Blastococcus sp. PRF04-17]UOY02805.1 pyridoxal 5'-phosphate synthase glutaminase subunit PdxT [Blastococcus sp. PRF04-17]